MTIAADGFIEKSPEINHGIVLVHLISGEDIIGDVFQNVSDGYVKIDSPMMPQVRTDDGKNFQVGLMPYRPFIDGALTIPAGGVLFVAKITNDMENLYRRFTSRIAVPESKITL